MNVLITQIQVVNYLIYRYSESFIDDPFLKLDGLPSIPFVQLPSSRLNIGGSQNQ